jgi:hypothetical protein
VAGVHAAVQAPHGDAGACCAIAHSAGGSGRCRWRGTTCADDDLVERDERDAKRAVAPMKPAPDAIVIDTSELSMNEVFEMALGIIQK